MNKLKVLSLKRKARIAIKETISFFEKNPEAFKTESDVKCYLYSRMIKNIPFLVENEFDNDKMYKELLITTELNTNKRYGKKDRVTKHSKKYDLVVLDPRYLDQKLKPLIAVEIKFNVKKALKSTYPQKGIYKDLNKLNRKSNEVEEGHLIILNNFEYTSTVDERFKKLKSYLQKENKLKNCSKLYVHARHVDYDTGKIKFKLNRINYKL